MRWMKFNAVGVIGAGVQLAALAFSKSVLRLDYRVATALAVEAAVLHNFAWHERWTWRDRDPRRGWRARLRRLAGFHLTNGAISMAGNLVLMQLLVGGLGLHYLAANLITITILSVANYLAADKLVFRGRPPE